MKGDGYLSSDAEDVIEIREFPRRDEYRHVCNIPLNSMPVGVYLVKYYLGNLCWASSSFEVVP